MFMRWTGDEAGGAPAVRARSARNARVPDAAAQYPLHPAMADWLNREWPDPAFGAFYQPFAHFTRFQQYPPQAQPHVSPPLKMQNHQDNFLVPMQPIQSMQPMQPMEQCNGIPLVPRGENPREIRNKAEKQRRDKLNKSIADLAKQVPPVVAASRKIDKTGILRLTAHYLRSHQYVFGDSIWRSPCEISSASAQAMLQIMNGFLLTTTYKGIVVVVSQNVQQFLGYTELDLLGQNILSITHKDDHRMLKEQLMPRSQTMGPNGDLPILDQPNGEIMVAEALAKEKRQFIVRFKKHTQRTEPAQYVTCHVEGSLRKSDRACRSNSRCCQMVRRARARGDNPCSSGNDVVFIGIVRPTSETFKKDRHLEQFIMEYRTRHSIDGQIIQCEKRIALITGYMTDEVHGVNAMNFMHRDDVRWVIIALREMYDQQRLYGESCYRLMMKNGQFIYMRTRGCLEVDSRTKAVTSFICTNTVMNAADGQHLIKLMKKKFTLLVNNNEDPPQEHEVTDTNDESLPVEDPQQLGDLIMHLVCNLPSPQPAESDAGDSPDATPLPHLAIIPPRLDVIRTAIKKIYDVITAFKNHKESERKASNAIRIDEITDHPVRADETPNKLNGSLPNISTICTYRTHHNLEYRQTCPTEQTPSSVEEIVDIDKPDTFAEYITKQPNKNSKFNFTKMDDECEIVDLDAPGSSNSVATMKRPNEYQTEDGCYKKKMIHTPKKVIKVCNSPNSVNILDIDLKSPFDQAFLDVTDILINSSPNSTLHFAEDVPDGVDILDGLECEPDSPPGEKRGKN